MYAGTPEGFLKISNDQLYTNLISPVVCRLRVYAPMP